LNGHAAKNDIAGGRSGKPIDCFDRVHFFYLLFPETAQVDNRAEEDAIVATKAIGLSDLLFA
jgi:hypothetical protein